MDNTHARTELRDNRGMTVEYLSLQDVADHLGITRGAVARYRLPEPDVRVGSSLNAPRGWSVETIDAWNAQRPGRGNWGTRDDVEREPEPEPERTIRPSLSNPSKLRVPGHSYRPKAHRMGGSKRSIPGCECGAELSMFPTTDKNARRIHGDHKKAILKDAAKGTKA